MPGVLYHRINLCLNVRGGSSSNTVAGLGLQRKLVKETELLRFALSTHVNEPHTTHMQHVSFSILWKRTQRSKKSNAVEFNI